jgi:alpha-glucosidase
LDDLDSLIEATHRHQLKLILYFVSNHTSDQHSWFVESKTSRNNPKRDWFIWRDPASDGELPNNWLSEFGEARGNSIRKPISIITIRFSPRSLT